MKSFLSVAAGSVLAMLGVAFLPGALCAGCVVLGFVGVSAGVALDN